MTAWAGLAAAATLLLAGCGSDDSGTADDSTSPSATESSSDAASESPVAEQVPAGTPECADVWSAGATLPRGYKGCAQDGALVKPDRLGCSSGQALVRYDDRFWAVRGGRIAGGETPLADSEEYTEQVAICRG
ncbi:hypothetical protein L615_000500000770 [Nocardioides sp. J9]|nr:hypothetical protein L615_000500000770 [Nocardioides sp. J9]